MSSRQRIIVIPAYREAAMIGRVVHDALGVADAVIVVDDGSPDRTSDEARLAGAVVIRHVINRGAGAATATGIAAATRFGATAVVTMDADGQHRAEDARRVFDRLDRGDVDVVIGSRMLPGQGGNMPAHRVLFNRIGNLLTWILFGVRVSDSQSGLKGLSADAARALELRTNRWEFSSEFVNEIRLKKWRLAEIPIQAIYTEYSLSKGQSLGGGFRTAAKLLSRRFLG